MVRVLIETDDCTPAQVASALGMHERTLQRRLQGEGASFEQIKDGVRRELAIMLLGDPDIHISRIAYKLHYTNASAFTRSCQRWFGLSPREVRQSLVEGRPLKVLKAG